MKLSPKEVHGLYAWRELAFFALCAKDRITLADLPDERGLLCLVADDLWDRCDGQARAFLSKHPHHFVRSSAAIAAAEPAYALA